MAYVACFVRKRIKRAMLSDASIKLAKRFCLTALCLNTVIACVPVRHPEWEARTLPSGCVAVPLETEMRSLITVEVRQDHVLRLGRFPGGPIREIDIVPPANANQVREMSLDWAERSLAQPDCGNAAYLGGTIRCSAAVPNSSLELTVWSTRDDARSAEPEERARELAAYVREHVLCNEQS